MAKHAGTVYEGEVLDWGFDWSDAICPTDSVISADWDVGANLVVMKETLQDDVSAIWLTGFTPGMYDLTNHIICSPSNRQFDQTIRLLCRAAGSPGGMTIDGGVWTDGDPMIWSDDDSWIWTEIT